MESIQISFGKNLRREIDRKHLKYGDAADLCEISLSFLNQIMKGTNAPSLEVFSRIVEKLGISADALMFGDSKPVPIKSKFDPSEIQSISQIADAMNELKSQLTIKSKISPALDESVARISARLATLDENQLRLVDGLIDDLLARTATDISHSKVR